MQHINKMQYIIVEFFPKVVTRKMASLYCLHIDRKKEFFETYNKSTSVFSYCIYEQN